MKRLNLLLADDDSDDCLFFEEAFLEVAPGSTLTIKKDGEEVIKYLFNPQSVLPDIIFLDLNMPFVDGVKCLEEIRSHRSMDHIFVVINTTTASRREIDHTFEMGANLFLIKPNSYDELKKSISSILQLDLKHMVDFRQRNRFVFSMGAFRNEW